MLRDLVSSVKWWDKLGTYGVHSKSLRWFVLYLSGFHFSRNLLCFFINLV